MGWWGRNTIASTDTILAWAMMNEEWIILPFPGKLWLYRVSTALQMLQIEIEHNSVCASLRKWQERSHKNRTWSYNGEYNIVFLWLVVGGGGGYTDPYNPYITYRILHCVVHTSLCVPWVCAPRAFPSTNSSSEPGHRCRAASKRENSLTEDLDITQIDNNKKTLATHLSINKLSTRDKLMYEGGDNQPHP